jgi:hypothetical protein
VPAGRLRLHLLLQMVMVVLLLPALLVLPAFATKLQLAVALAAMVCRHLNQTE